MVGLTVAIVTVVSARAPWWVHVIAAGMAMGVAVDPAAHRRGRDSVWSSPWSAGPSRGASPVLRAARRRDHPQRAGPGRARRLPRPPDRRRRRGRRRAVRRRPHRLLAPCPALGVGRCRRPRAAGAALSTAAFALEAARSRDELSVRSAVGRVGGDRVGVGRRRRQAEAGLRLRRVRAGHRARQPQLRRGRSAASLVPVVAQHRSAAIDMSAVGSDGAATVAEALAGWTSSRCASTGGRIDVDRLAALGDQLVEVRVALDEVVATAHSSRSPWLVGRATLRARRLRDAASPSTCPASTRRSTPCASGAVDARRRRAAAPTSSCSPRRRNPAASAASSAATPSCRRSTAGSSSAPSDGPRTSTTTIAAAGVRVPGNRPSSSPGTDGSGTTRTATGWSATPPSATWR